MEVKFYYSGINLRRNNNKWSAELRLHNPFGNSLVYQLIENDSRDLSRQIDLLLNEYNPTLTNQI